MPVSYGSSLMAHATFPFGWNHICTRCLRNLASGGQNVLVLGCRLFPDFVQINKHRIDRLLQRQRWLDHVVPSARDALGAHTSSCLKTKRRCHGRFTVSNDDAKPCAHGRASSFFLASPNSQVAWCETWDDDDRYQTVYAEPWPERVVSES
jgi:hypothetical protein